MVKAYLRYEQHDIIGGLVGNKSNIIICTVNGGAYQMSYIVSACNEVVNLTNIRTGEIDYKVYDKEALFG